MRQSIVLSTHAAQFEAVAFKGDLAANVAKVAGWGYDAVEVAVRDPGLVDPDELESLVSRNGLNVSAIGTGQAWGEEGLSLTSDDPSIRTAARQRLESHVPLAQRLESLIILGLIRGITPKAQTHERSMGYLIEALRGCTGVAAEAGVRFALEPLNRYETDLVHTVAEGLDLIDRVGADNLGLLLDTFHMNIEEPDIEASVKACGDRIFHFHVADSNRWYPGAGHLDFGSILATLSATGYRGYVSGEFLPLPDADTAAELGLSHLRAVLRRGVETPEAGDG
jgi:sugar phosphate isomerase/epimerase